MRKVQFHVDSKSCTIHSTKSAQKPPMILFAHESEVAGRDFSRAATARKINGGLQPLHRYSCQSFEGA
jgi:hypothetical protein